MKDIATRIANTPDAYGGRFHTIADAQAARYRYHGGAGKYRIILGDDDTFWVMRGTYAQALIAAGYQQA